MTWLFDYLRHIVSEAKQDSGRNKLENFNESLKTKCELVWQYEDSGGGSYVEVLNLL